MPARGVCAQRLYASTGPGVRRWATCGCASTPSCATSPIAWASGQGQFPDTLGVHACTGWLPSGFTTATQEAPANGLRGIPPGQRSRGLDHLGNLLACVLNNECCKVRACRPGLGNAPHRSCAVAGKPKGWVEE